MQGGGIGRFRGRATDERDSAPRDRAQEEEETSAVLQGSNFRAGETFPSTEIPERPGERAPGVDHSTDSHPGENLVPESQVQDEEGRYREGGSRGERMFAEKSRGTVAN